MVRVSIIVPSKRCEYLSYLFLGLRGQSVKPCEIVLVLKECNLRHVENLCNRSNLPCVIIEQKHGYFTHALNLGKKEAKGDLLIFTDDDAIPLNRWIERYVKLYRLYPNVAGISSRDIYLDLRNMRLLSTPDDKPMTKLYRWVVRPWLEIPHPLLRKYRMGIYLTKNLNITHGPFIPSRECFSLPFRGINMSFKTSHIYDAWFPEHKLLIKAPGNEQYFGLQLILKGLDTIYVPNNPVLHITRAESLSRTRSEDEIELETKIMRSLYRSLLQKHGISA
jgi:hypothetical protein